MTMQPFKLTLANGAALTGLHNHPERSAAFTALEDRHRPLIIAIHGGTYSSSYFDADAKHSATLCSNSLGIPVVAIDRPLYEGSTSLYPLPDGESYHGQLAVWLHRFILPALWAEFGKGCSSMLLHCHSLATPGAVIAAGMHARQEGKPTYPLAGLTISGFGSRVHHANRNVDESRDEPSEFINFSIEAKDDMLPAGTADPEIYKQTRRLNKPMPAAELQSMAGIWLHDTEQDWKTFAADVKVPVMIGIAERDTLWVGTEEHVKEFAGGFTRSSRVDASLVKDAPHCLELSYWAQGWYARCFGFAMECAVGFAVRQAQ